MACIKKIKSEEISGSTFRGRDISLVGDIIDYLLVGIELKMIIMFKN